MSFRSLAIAVFSAVVLAGCAGEQTSTAPSAASAPSTDQVTAASAPALTAPGALTFCGLTEHVQLTQPPAGLPENLRRFYGAWLGHDQGSCLAYVMNSISTDGSVDFVVFEGSGKLGVFPHAEPRHGKIAGDTLTYIGPAGSPILLTLVDGYLHTLIHDVRAGDSAGILQRVGSGEERSAQ